MIIRWSAEKYAPLWRCMYCGDENREKLTDEHIIPFGLLPKGGDWFLPKASCLACAEFTKKFEDRCLQFMLGPLRQQIGLKSRRKKNSKIVARFNYRDGRLDDREISLSEFPPLCVGFKWKMPGLLLGDLPTNQFEGEFSVRYAKGSIENSVKDGEALRIARVSQLDFARMLAKIAHSFAVAKYGMDSFSPLLLDLIKCETDIAPYFVGGEFMEDLPEQPAALHDIFRNDCRRDSGPTFFGVSIRLFAFMGMPSPHISPYQCAIGRIIRSPCFWCCGRACGWRRSARGVLESFALPTQRRIGLGGPWDDAA